MTDTNTLTEEEATGAVVAATVALLRETKPRTVDHVILQAQVGVALCLAADVTRIADALERIAGAVEGGVSVRGLSGTAGTRKPA